MYKYMMFGAILVATLSLAPSSAQAQCDAGSIQGEAPGTWKVNNAGGEGFGGWFVHEDGEAVAEEKPEVVVSASGGGIAVGQSGELDLSNFHSEAGDNGGAWCGFTLGSYSARLGKADNGWWILEIGAHDGNQVELIKR